MSVENEEKATVQIWRPYRHEKNESQYWAKHHDEFIDLIDLRWLDSLRESIEKWIDENDVPVQQLLEIVFERHLNYLQEEDYWVALSVVNREVGEDGTVNA